MLETSPNLASQGDALVKVPAASRPIWVVSLAACVGIVAVKLLLIQRINVNWDEFYFLNLVHAAARGELDQVFQTACTHLFGWLPALSGGELRQVLVARAVMWVLFAVTIFLIARLASRWVRPSFAWIAPWCFLAAEPVLRHGASFRADSLLAPLMLAVLVLLSVRQPSRTHLVISGLLLGLAGAISVKAAFIVPIAGALVLALAVDSEPKGRALRSALGTLLLLGAVAAVTAGALLLLHRLSLPALPVEDAQTFVGRAVQKTLLDVPLLPRGDYLVMTALHDKATWILLLGGFLTAVHRRNWAVLACSLSLLPVLFYRNAYPYYYVIMLAPACVLAAYAAEALRDFVARTSAAGARWVPLAICLPLLLQAAVNLERLRGDEQARQRVTIAGVHEIFPEPVPYIDHSGMIASFPKVNFFMTSWGVEQYRARGESFMAEAIARHRPPLLLVNRGELDPESPRFSWLLPVDQQLILQFYVPYWGPVRVAGAEVLIPAQGAVTAAVPFPGAYRLEAAASVVVDGAVREPGDTIEITGTSCVLALPEGHGTEPVPARLVWAAARPAPNVELPRVPIYTGL